MSKRLANLDVMRMIALYGIMLLHVSALAISEVPTEIGANALANNATRLALPLFVMISGTLALDPARSFRFLPRLGRIAFAYAGYSAFYVALAMFCGLDSGAGLPTTAQEIFNAWLHGPYHIWYLMMLFGMTLVTPIFRPIAEKPRIFAYAASWVFLCAFIMPRALPLLPDIYTTHWSTLLAFSGTAFFFYYLAGYLAPRIPLWAGFLAFAAGLAGHIWRLQGATDIADLTLRTAENRPQSAFLVVGFFVILWHLIRLPSPAWLRTVNRWSLHIYLLSPLWIYAVQFHWLSFLPKIDRHSSLGTLLFTSFLVLLGSALSAGLVFTALHLPKRLLNRCRKPTPF